jgi:acyl-CoA synthetase (NDP forming)
MSTQIQAEAERAAAILADAVQDGLPALDEAQAKRVLAAYGVPVPAGGLAASAAEAVDLATSLGGPVAMKAIGPLIQHKTESGLVLLDLRSANEVAEAYATLAARAGDALESVLVEEMISGSREFMVGMMRDAAFGPVVAFGLGGTMTEVFHDIALAIPPVVEGDVKELLDLVHARKLLGDRRHRPGGRADRRRAPGGRRDRRQSTLDRR